MPVPGGSRFEPGFELIPSNLAELGRVDGAQGVKGCAVRNPAGLGFRQDVVRMR